MIFLIYLGFLALSLGAPTPGYDWDLDNHIIDDHSLLTAPIYKTLAPAPIYSPPIIKTISTPIIKTVPTPIYDHSPIYTSAPIIKAAPIYAPAPIIKSAPIYKAIAPATSYATVTSYQIAHAPVFKTLVASPILKTSLSYGYHR